MLIRPASPADWPLLWPIIEPVIRAGETYALDRDMGEAAARDYWLGTGKQTFVAVAEDQVLGSYYLRANQAGGGAHVANCGYMVGEAARGRGVARALCAHSIEAARAAGFAAIQFNCVVSSNAAAVHLWQAMGFAIVGRLPLAFRHPALGPVDALVMFRPL